MKAFIRPILLGFVVASILLCASCKPPERDGRIVEIRSDQAIEVLDYMNWTIAKAGADRRFAVYLSDFSLVGVNVGSASEEFLFLYRSTDGVELDLRIDGDLLLVNGVVRSIQLGGDEERNFATWVASTRREDLQSVGFIQVDEVILDRYANELKAIAEASPDCSIQYQDGRYVEGFSLHLKPLVLCAGEGPTVKGLDLGEVRVVVIGDETDAEDQPAWSRLSPLSLPKLLRLVLLNVTEESRVRPEVFPRVGALSVSGMRPGLSGFSDLHELHLGIEDSETVYDLGELPNPDLLRYLSIAGDWNQIKGADRLTRLEFLNPGEISEVQLEAVVAANPNLVFLDLLYADIESLRPLAMASRLEGIVLGDIDMELDLTPLRELKHLRFVGLSGASLDDPAILAKVREYCPGCVIYGQSPFCLGSGWLVLALPLILLVMLWKWARARSG